MLDWSCRTLRLLLERGGFRRFLKPSKPGKKAKEDHLDRFLVLARLSSGSACYTVNLKDGRSAIIREEFGRGCCFLTRLSHTHTHTHTHAQRQNTHRHSGNSCSSQQSHFRPLRTSGSGCLSCSAGSCRTYGNGAGVGGLPTWRYVNDMCGMCCGVWRKPRTLHRGLLRALFVSPVSCFDSPPN